jgi:hypothetical protein
MSLFFLKPRLTNVLLTLVVLSLPVIWEIFPLPGGGYGVDTYRPLFLLVRYLQTTNCLSFFFMVGFSLVVYVAVSFVLAIFLRLRKKRSK